MSDPARCRILLALASGEPLPATRLAADAGIAAATASGHLQKLTSAGLLAVESSGRYRNYRLAGADVMNLIEALEQLAPVLPVRSLRQSIRSRAIREAVVCYDHAGGKLGVDLMKSMIEHGYLEAMEQGRPMPPKGQGLYRVTASGRTFLDEFGVDASVHRLPVRHHVDSMDAPNPHLSGGLGRGLLQGLLDLDWVRRSNATRALTITTAGHQGLAREFGIHL
ncbi:MAG: ArsR/SmtB family transcription factor [Candidatus Dormibacteraceae bacterium]